MAAKLTANVTSAADKGAYKISTIFPWIFPIMKEEEEWEKDCVGNCPGINYLANQIEFQYNSDGLLLDSLMVMDNDSIYIDESILINLYGESWLDSIDISTIELGFDCNNECYGVEKRMLNSPV